MKKTTLVTALFDIGRDKWIDYNMSYHTYLDWFKNTLSFKTNMVIFTEEKFYDEIYGFRSKIDPDMSKTKIIVKKLEDLFVFQTYLTNIESLMNSEEFKKKTHFPLVPEMSKPLYNVVTFNKPFFLKEVKDQKYFDSDFLFWVDSGGLREKISNYHNTEWPNQTKTNNLPKDKITFFSHSKDFDIPDKEYHSLSQIRYIQGGCFIVPTDLIEMLIRMVIEVIDEFLDGKYIGSDEKIFDLIYIKNKKYFNLIKCGWREYFNILN